MPANDAPKTPFVRALITGGGSGIGLALAAALKARGTNVIVADLDAAPKREAASAIGAEFLPVDLRRPHAAEGMIDTAWRTFGQLDLVCSNAGVPRNKRLKREPLDQDARDLFEVNVFAAVRIAQAYSTLLEAHDQTGALMITGSENSLSAPKAVETFGLGLYGASKHAVLALAEWLRLETVGGPLAVHVLLPGPVYSPPLAAAIPDPNQAPPGFDLISCERCAEIALDGLDKGQFYIPTHPHLLTDMHRRCDGIAAALKALALDAR